MVSQKKFYVRNTVHIPSILFVVCLSAYLTSPQCLSSGSYLIYIYCVWLALWFYYLMFVLRLKWAFSRLVAMIDWLFRSRRCLLQVLWLVVERIYWNIYASMVPGRPLPLNWSQLGRLISIHIWYLSFYGSSIFSRHSTNVRTFYLFHFYPFFKVLVS